MQLIRVEIEGYRSINSKVDIHVQRDVTVLLGPNDHGKTNILNAIEHMNRDKLFDGNVDLNWDQDKQPGDFPCIAFRLSLDRRDRTAIFERWTSSDPSVVTDASVVDDIEGDVIVRTLEPSDIPNELVVQVKGVDTERTYKSGEVPQSVLEEFANDNLPRVEIIRPYDDIPDAISEAQLDQESHDFMRGILYYAGIDPSEAGSLFTQTDATMKQLTTASETLNEDLKAGWTQGKDLQYRLNHQSAKKEIELRIQDPAVEARYVRASSRSSGFTHFFALKTILHARQQDHPANSYVFLFDEPGIYLHPSGQYDLLAVLDVIGKRNQVIYSTHSLFMINKTFPARHRLIVKDDSGTRIDGKPYIGRWESVIRELGLSLAGTVLFSQHIVLAEGDSDPMLIQAVFQKLVEWDKASVDLNAFAVIATRESKNTDALVRILTEGSGGPSIMVLVDGDEGGKERLRQLTPLLDSHDIETHRLVAGTTIEDYLPGAGTRYVQAVARYVAKIAETHGRTDLSGQEIDAQLLGAAEANDIREDKVTSGIAKWATREAQELVALESAPSKLGIAREYVELLSEAKADTFKDSQLKRSLGLLRQIQGALGIPELQEPEKKVTTD